MRNFPHKLNSTDMAIMPAGNNLFNNVNGKPLGTSQAEYLHAGVAKDVFLLKIVRPDIQPTIYVLATRLISLNIVHRKNW